ncbi:hypothetical protein [Nocardioides donggukensis]|uniref:Uncharacterized protein n=1 Tax=Nocardioides donggukensis TaxID=2774019 RepID=A0A927K5M5_9ACTN|nr:hypothetical protein [Nocardioides donggukensis]MBD8871182.1 hypothetical protein [Nocardioides donggukensis]
MDKQDDGRWQVTATEAEALQAVVDRVSSWQDGAEGGVVRDEFGSVAGEVGITVPDELAESLCADIEHRDERPDLSRYVTVA